MNDNENDKSLEYLLNNLNNIEVNDEKIRLAIKKGQERYSREAFSPKKVIAVSAAAILVFSLAAFPVPDSKKKHTIGRYSITVPNINYEEKLFQFLNIIKF